MSHRKPPVAFIELEFADGHSESFGSDNVFEAVRFAKRQWDERRNYDPMLVEIWVIDAEDDHPIFHRSMT